MAQGIEPVTRQEVTPGSTGWQDVDASAYGVPAGAEGVVVEFVNNEDANNVWGLRKNGSTDTFTGGISALAVQIAAIGLDGSRIFECYLDDITNVDVFLIGYIPAGAGGFLDNAVDKIPGTEDAWTDLDISGDTGGDTAKIAIFFIDNVGAELVFGLRENGSTDDRTYSFSHWQDMDGVMMAVDVNEICEIYLSFLTNLAIYFVGWINSGYADSFVDAKDYSTGTTGSWVDTTCTDVPSASEGVFYHFFYTLFNGQCGIRPDEGAGVYGRCSSRHRYGWVEAVSQVVEQKIDSSAVDLFVWGYVKEGAVAAFKGSRGFIIG